MTISVKEYGGILDIFTLLDDLVIIHKLTKLGGTGGLYSFLSCQ